MMRVLLNQQVAEERPLKFHIMPTKQTIDDFKEIATEVCGEYASGVETIRACGEKYGVCIYDEYVRNNRRVSGI